MEKVRMRCACGARYRVSPARSQQPIACPKCGQTISVAQSKELSRNDGGHQPLSQSPAGGLDSPVEVVEVAEVVDDVVVVAEDVSDHFRDGDPAGVAADFAPLYVSDESDVSSSGPGVERGLFGLSSGFDDLVDVPEIDYANAPRNSLGTVVGPSVSDNDRGGRAMRGDVDNVSDVLANAERDSGSWRHGSYLVVAGSTRLPNRCLQSDEPATVECYQDVHIFPPPLNYIISASVVLFGAFGGLVAVRILASVLGDAKESYTVRYWLSDRRLFRFRLLTFATLGAAIVGLTVMIVAAFGISFHVAFFEPPPIARGQTEPSATAMSTLSQGWLIAFPTGLITFLVGCFAYDFILPVRVHRTDAFSRVWLSGGCKPYLSRFSDYPSEKSPPLHIFWHRLFSFVISCCVLAVVVGVLVGPRLYAFHEDAVSIGDSTAPFDIEAVPLPSLSPAPTFSRGHDSVYAQVSLGVESGTPGQSDIVQILAPKAVLEDNGDRRWPCVLVSAPGGTLLSGKSMDTKSLEQFQPLVEAGFLVVSYDCDGDAGNEPTDDQLRDAFQDYRDSLAGLVNARNAIEFITGSLKQVDPRRVYSLGHSSAGKQALLTAAHDDRVAGCVSLSGVADARRSARSEEREYYRTITPLADAFLKKSSPLEHVKRIKCPVFLFHTKNDPIVKHDQVRSLENRLRDQGNVVHVSYLEYGDHYQTPMKEGLSEALRWLKSIDQAIQTMGEGGPNAMDDSTGESTTSSGSMAKALATFRQLETDSEGVSSVAGFQSPAAVFDLAMHSERAQLAVSHESFGVALYDLNAISNDSLSPSRIIAHPSGPCVVCFKDIADKSYLIVGNSVSDDFAWYDLEDGSLAGSLQFSKYPGIGRVFTSHLVSFRDKRDPRVFVSATLPSTRGRATTKWLSVSLASKEVNATVPGTAPPLDHASPWQDWSWRRTAFNPLEVEADAPDSTVAFSTGTNKRASVDSDMADGGALVAQAMEVRQRLQASENESPMRSEGEAVPSESLREFAERLFVDHRLRGRADLIWQWNSPGIGLLHDVASRSSSHPLSRFDGPLVVLETPGVAVGYIEHKSCVKVFRVTDGQLMKSIELPSLGVPTEESESGFVDQVTQVEGKSREMDSMVLGMFADSSRKHITIGRRDALFVLDLTSLDLREQPRIQWGTRKFRAELPAGGMVDLPVSVHGTVTSVSLGDRELNFDWHDGALSTEIPDDLIGTQTLHLEVDLKGETISSEMDLSIINDHVLLPFKPQSIVGAAGGDLLLAWSAAAASGSQRSARSTASQEDAHSLVAPAGQIRILILSSNDPSIRDDFTVEGKILAVALNESHVFVVLEEAAAVSNEEGAQPDGDRASSRAAHDTEMSTSYSLNKFAISAEPQEAHRPFNASSFREAEIVRSLSFKPSRIELIGDKALALATEDPDTRSRRSSKLTYRIRPSDLRSMEPAVVTHTSTPVAGQYGGGMLWDGVLWTGTPQQRTLILELAVPALGLPERGSDESNEIGQQTLPSWNFESVRNRRMTSKLIEVPPSHHGLVDGHRPRFHVMVDRGAVVTMPLSNGQGLGMSLVPFGSNTPLSSVPLQLSSSASRLEHAVFTGQSIWASSSHYLYRIDPSELESMELELGTGENHTIVPTKPMLSADANQKINLAYHCEAASSFSVQAAWSSGVGSVRVSRESLTSENGEFVLAMRDSLNDAAAVIVSTTRPDRSAIMRELQANKGHEVDEKQLQKRVDTVLTRQHQENLKRYLRDVGLAASRATGRALKGFPAILNVTVSAQTDYVRPIQLTHQVVVDVPRSLVQRMLIKR